MLQIKSQNFYLIILSNSQRTMKISYAFVFYFQLAMVALTAGLIILYFKPMRSLLFGTIEKYKIGKGPLYITAWWIVFAVICLILADSVLTYWAIRETLEFDNKDMIIDNFDTMNAKQHDDYIIIYKKLREYFMAERNFMLTSSTLFVWFVFKMFLTGFKKIYHNENTDSNLRPAAEPIKAD